jgi:phosphoribosylanthranilate isomerase
MTPFLVKVCCINRENNLKRISSLDIDMIGLNFYLGSKRFINNISITINPKVKRVGVFVNPSMYELLQYSEDTKLDYIQLHGDESPDFCIEAKEICPIIKAFGIDEDFDFALLKEYDMVEYFLFDTKVSTHGGSGTKFNWDKLNEYQGKIPFLLAGGIGPDDAETIKELKHPMFIGVDINSKFEIEPGLKHVPKVDQFVKELKN